MRKPAGQDCCCWSWFWLCWSSPCGQLRKALQVTFWKCLKASYLPSHLIPAPETDWEGAWKRSSTLGLIQVTQVGKLSTQWRRRDNPWTHTPRHRVVYLFIWIPKSSFAVRKNDFCYIVYIFMTKVSDFRISEIIVCSDWNWEWGKSDLQRFLGDVGTRGWE